jgi:hypothetical protein
MLPELLDQIPPDQEIASKFQVRVAILNGLIAFGIPVTEVVG